MADKVPDNVAFITYEKNGVVHRKHVTPEEAQAWIDGQQGIGHLRGEPMVEGGKLIEHHGLPEDPHAEPVEPTVLGEPFDPDELDESDHPYPEP